MSSQVNLAIFDVLWYKCIRMWAHGLWKRTEHPIFHLVFGLKLSREAKKHTFQMEKKKRYRVGNNNDARPGFAWYIRTLRQHIKIPGR